MSENLEELRGQIDQIDQQMVALFKARMEASGRVAEYKKEKGCLLYTSPVAVSSNGAE